MNSEQLASALLEDDEDFDPKEFVMKHGKPQVMTVVLVSVGNPDFGEYFGAGEKSPTKHVNVRSYAEASQVVRKYIVKYDLGGGNWGRYGPDGEELPEASGDILINGKKVARVSYNGRVWDLNDKEIPIT